jgi:hypothetical protein
MSTISIIRKLCQAVASNFGAEECSVLLALIVIVGLTAMSAMGSLSVGQAASPDAQSSWVEKTPIP